MKKIYHNPCIPVSVKDKEYYMSKLTAMFREIAYEEYWKTFMNGGRSMDGYVLSRTERLIDIFEKTININEV